MTVSNIWAKRERRKSTNDIFPGAQFLATLLLIPVMMLLGLIVGFIIALVSSLGAVSILVFLGFAAVAAILWFISPWTAAVTDKAMGG